MAGENKDGRRGLWVYCVIEDRGGTLPQDMTGIHGDSSVCQVADGNYAMIVSEEPMKKYPLSRDFLVAHQLVNEKMLQGGPVLPVKFCTMAEDANQIITQVLRQKARTDEFQKAFNEIRGKNEYGLRARWKDLDQIFANLEFENEKLKMAKEKILRLPERERHGGLIDVGHLVKEALEEKKTSVANSMMQALIPHAAKYKRNSILGDMNILNAAFLVDANKQGQFDEAVNSLVGREEAGIQFKYVGPTPPFNFVEIVIRWEKEA